MAKMEEIPKTNPAEVENLIEQIRAANLEPSAKEKIERLLRTILLRAVGVALREMSGAI